MYQSLKPDGVNPCEWQIVDHRQKIAEWPCTAPEVTKNVSSSSYSIKIVHVAMQNLIKCWGIGAMKHHRQLVRVRPVLFGRQLAFDPFIELCSGQRIRYRYANLVRH